jgi:hypothetical protein
MKINSYLTDNTPESGTAVYEIMAVDCVNPMKHINALCEQNAEILTLGSWYE